MKIKPFQISQKITIPNHPPAVELMERLYTEGNEAFFEDITP